MVPSGINKHLYVVIQEQKQGIFTKLRDHAKFMAYTGPEQMGYGTRTFSTHINNEGGTFF